MYCLECEDGYRRYAGNCYKMIETDLTMELALETCINMDSGWWAPKQQGEEVAIPRLVG